MIKKIILFSLISFSLLAAPLPLLAEEVLTLPDSTGEELGYDTDSDIRDVVVNIVNWVLGILALAAVIMVIYGGIRWMTAGGNEENITIAKKILSAAIIGLIIVLLAWAITTFLFSIFGLTLR